MNIVTELRGIWDSVTGRLTGMIPAGATGVAPLIPAILALPGADASSRPLTAADDGSTRFPTSTPAYTVPPGMAMTYGVAFIGACTFVQGAGVTITDQRTAGAANPNCCLVHGVAANAYYLIGSTT